MSHDSEAAAPLEGSGWRDPFQGDNRAGLDGTLHRISAIRDRDRSVIGLTYRIGRHMEGPPPTAMSVVGSLGVLFNQDDLAVSRTCIVLDKYSSRIVRDSKQTLFTAS